MAPRKSPRNAVCQHCGGRFTKGGLKQHLRYVKCSPTSTASPRKFKRVRCKHCSKSFHSTNSLRVHVSTVHAKEYAKSPGLMKHHRSPYHKQKHSAAHRQEKADDPKRPAHSSTRASTRADERSPSPRAHTGGPDPNHRSTRRLSSGERRGHHKHTASYSGDTGDKATNPAWHREMTKKMAEAAGQK